MIVLLLHDDLDGTGIGVVAFLIARKTSHVEVLVHSSGILMQNTLQISVRDLFFLAITGLVPFDSTTMADDFVFHTALHHVLIDGYVVRNLSLRCAMIKLVREIG